MSSLRVKAPEAARKKAPVPGRRTTDRRPGASRVLGRRNPAVVAVGAWVEGGREFPQHPAVLALLTEELQAERRRESEESLQRFQDEVRHRVAQRTQVCKKRQPPQTDAAVTHDRRAPPQLHQVWNHNESPGETLTSAAQRRSSQEFAEGMRQVRLRLAACRVIPHEDATSDLPGGDWNVSPTRHKAEWGKGDDVAFNRPLHGPFVQQKGRGWTAHETDKSHPDPDSEPSPAVPAVLWPLTDQEELKRQRQSEFLMHRRLVMTAEREKVKENKQQRKHLKRTARIKAEKELLRLEEERRLAEEKQLEEERRLEEAGRAMDERKLLILERLRLEEEERAEELQRRKTAEKEKVSERYVEALRCQMKERLSQAQLDLPPLCFCASSFWDSHPDTCANNCVFHDNPKEYTQALHSTMLSLDLQ